MDRAFGHRMKRNVLGQGAHNGAIDRQFDDGIQEMASAQRLCERFFFQVDGHRRLVVAIDDGGCTAGTTQHAGGSLAYLFACFGRQMQRFAHVSDP